MLLEISYNFINIIITVVNFLISAGRSSWFYHILELTNVGLNIFHLFLLCVLAENIKTKVCIFLNDEVNK